MLLDVEHLSISVQRDKTSRRKVVDDISFQIGKGEMFGLVGESGCGKTLTALSLAGLLPQGISSDGRILLEGTDIAHSNGQQMRSLQGSRISMIFQEPMTSLNPLMKAGRQVEENLRLHTGMTADERRAAVLGLFAKTGLPDPERVYEAYPHQLSGGMRQRVMIALAVILRPSLIIADEPTTALDVTVQAKILRLLKQINHESGAAILLISHDLSVVSSVCGRVAVMYAGKIVETGPAAEIFVHPAHEYTRALVGAIPTRDKKGARLISIAGNVPLAGDGAPTVGQGAACPFAPRCPRAQEVCFKAAPPWLEPQPGHLAACIYACEGERN